MSETTTTSGRPIDEALTGQILEATWRVLSEKGYAAVDIQSIAKSVGCGKSTIYRRWPTKAALAAAALQRSAVVGTDPDTGSVLEDLLVFALASVRNQPGRLAAVSVEAGPEVAEHLWGSVYGARQSQVIVMLERGIARGELPDDTDVMALIDLLSGFTLYRIAVRMNPPAEDDLRAVISALVQSPPRAAG